MARKPCSQRAQAARAANAAAAQPTAARPGADDKSQNTAEPAKDQRNALPKKKLSYKEQRELDGLPALMAALEDDEFEGAPVPEPLAPALATLDAGAEEIRAALAQDPGSVHLLDQLRRTYARRLSLTQRGLAG